MQQRGRGNGRGRKLELVWPHKEGRLLYRKNAKGITEPHFVGPCAIAPRPLIDVEQTGSERGKRWSPDSNLLIVGDTPNPTRGGWSHARLRCQWLSLLACRSPAHVVRANVPTRWSITRRSARIRPRSLRGQCAMGASQYQHPSGKDATPLLSRTRFLLLPRISAPGSATSVRALDRHLLAVETRGHRCGGTRWGRRQ